MQFLTLPNPMACPSCGSQKIEVREEEWVWALLLCRCNACGYSPGLEGKPTKQEAIKEWNEAVVRMEAK